MRLSILVLLCLAVVGGTPAFAKKPSLVVVELVPDAKTRGIDPALVKFASQLSARLRSRAGEVYTIVPSKDDGSAALFCLDKAPACWASIGVEAKAEWMIYGSVQKVGDRFHVTVKLHQVASKDRVKKAVFEVVPANTIGDITDLLAKQIYSKLHGEPVPQTR